MVMKLEVEEGHHVLSLTRAEAEEIHAAQLKEMLINSEIDPLLTVATEGIFGTTQLDSQDLATRILQYAHIVGSKEIVDQFEALEIDDDVIEGVRVGAPTTENQLEANAKITAAEAYQKVYEHYIKNPGTKFALRFQPI